LLWENHGIDSRLELVARKLRKVYQDRGTPEGMGHRKKMQEAAHKIPTGDGNMMGQVGMVLTVEEYRKRVGENIPDWGFRNRG
jgi:hypothetical protein